MTETQETITAWGTETFGPTNTLRLVARANTEMAELLAEVSSFARPDRIADECADVLIVLARAASLMGVNVAFESVKREPTASVVERAAAMANSSLSGVFACVAMGWMPEASAKLIDLWRDVEALMQKCKAIPARRVDAKMAVNRKRKWVLAGDGTGEHMRHVREGEAA